MTQVAMYASYVPPFPYQHTLVNTAHDFLGVKGYLVISAIRPNYLGFLLVTVSPTSSTHHTTASLSIHANNVGFSSNSLLENSLSYHL